MTRPISLHRLAQTEINDETDYYFEIDPELGREFLDRAERAFDEIVENPKASMIVVENVRPKLVDRFPVSIYYIFNEEVFRVVAVASDKRRPLYWMDRF
ncbi:MAG TPA: hypothetical protein VGJ02_08905 [Pyrinomonadaceae bacterium]|jgi:plasmid stabilization system protein ParE